MNGREPSPLLLQSCGMYPPPPHTLTHKCVRTQLAYREYVYLPARIPYIRIRSLYNLRPSFIMSFSFVREHREIYIRTYTHIYNTLACAHTYTHTDANSHTECKETSSPRGGSIDRLEEDRPESGRERERERGRELCPQLDDTNVKGWRWSICIYIAVRRGLEGAESSPQVASILYTHCGKR